MKSLLGTALVISSVIALILVGCAQPAPSPAPTSAPVPTSTAPSTPTTTTSAPGPKPTSTQTPIQAAGKPVKLAVAMSTPQIGWVSQHAMVPWLKQITDATSGSVQFEIYYDQSLCKQNQVWQAVQNGVADVGLVIQASFPGLTPITDVTTLAFMPLDTAKKNSAVFWKMYEKYPAIQNEYKSVHVLALWCTPPCFLSNSKREVKTIGDIKGFRLKYGGGLPVAEAVQLLGAAPITMSAADTYMNLQKGVIDGAITNWDAFSSYKLYEVVKYYNYAPYFAGNFSLVMNNEKWNSLPKVTQDAINKISGLNASEFWGYNQFDSAEGPTKQDVKKGGWSLTEYTMPQSEVDKMTEVAGKPTWDKWVKDMKAKGVSNAQEVLDSLVEIRKTIK